MGLMDTDKTLPANRLVFDVRRDLAMVERFRTDLEGLMQDYGLSDAEKRALREVDVAGAEALAPTHLVISPGPCTPKEAGISGALLSHFKGRIPALGVCLGHQAIGDVHGMTVRRNDIAVHGKTSLVEHDGRGLFAGLPNPFVATRYHSLLVERATFPKDLEITAETAEGEVMGLRHRTLPVWGVQFHPESIATEGGMRILQNFLSLN
mgnify:CR=1 FL=1